VNVKTIGIDGVN